jgi:hypothetical protein
MLDDCHSFNVTTNIDGQETGGKMRVDSAKGLLHEDGGDWKEVLSANSDSIVGCKFKYNDPGFSKDIEKTTPKQCCFH